MKSWSEGDGRELRDPVFDFDLIDQYGIKGCHYQGIDVNVLAGNTEQCIPVPGPVIVGAGPSGLAVAACLKKKGIPSVILERSHCIASLWQLKTYNRLRLHLPKHFCELPLMPFPACFPTYPTREQFVSYLDTYTRQFNIRPVFNSKVVSAEFDQQIELWRVKTVRMKDGKEVEYVSRWLIAATGTNAEEVLPEINGMEDFKGSIIHTSSYKSGDAFQGQRVLVIGCGNSGMEVCLDLCDHNAQPSMAVREGVHVLPRQIVGWSTFGLSTWLLKLLPVRVVDNLLLLVSRFMLGNTVCHGLHRPRKGPLELKLLTGKTPVLDAGALAKIKSGDIQVLPAVKRLTAYGAEFMDGRMEDFDATILATGYRSNIHTWLKEGGFICKDGSLPRRPFCNGWKWERGLYAVGFSPRGLFGTSIDARRIADDIEQCWNADANQ